ncbi:Trafficking protein particle complex subunit 1 [Borealophlyctis nickersoniae]|nr:Trafficking protein particle complex subunit 1 [Borealophlyctis nickersoniae]
MTIYNIYIFDRHCRCIFFTEWKRRSQQPSLTDGPTGPDGAAGAAGGGGNQPATGGGMVGTGGKADIAFEEEAKLVYGVVFSLRNLINKLTPKQGSEGFTSYRTNVYKLHYFETASGLRFILNTDPHMDSMRDTLRSIYSNIYVEFVTKNPLQPFDTPIKNDLFKTSLNRFMRSVPGFD